MSAVSKPIAAAEGPRTESELVDLRFRALVGEEAWGRLPGPVRRRFSKRIAEGEMVLYAGRVVATELSLAGRVLAFLLRAIGGPLPAGGATGEALVAVTEDAALGGQTWTRVYARPGRFPQVVHSAKRFRGPSGLEEHIGCGIAMTLCVTVEEGALHFRSAGYFVELGRFRIAVPRALSPGAMEIVHREEPAHEAHDRDGGAFSFRLTLTHPYFGRLVHQLAYFRDGSALVMHRPDRLAQRRP
ncbi:MAG TPA: DUF4166 domain-containing protein [Hyphomicrobiaceae bacterium]|nr:DUF4166 domain-containing protein [Hyphomicrobiaceae bacterium]